jgi:hypothetical protein
LQYYWYSTTLFYFPSFPKFHRVVPLLLTCSTFECVYDHSCVCVLVHLLYLPCMRENMQPLSFWAWLTSLHMMSSNCIHLPSNYVTISYGWVKLHCVYIPQFLDPFISFRAPGLFS